MTGATYDTPIAMKIISSKLHTPRRGRAPGATRPERRPESVRAQTPHLCHAIILLTSALTLCAAAAPNSTPEKTYRIMPVGDSITQGGQTFSNYRLPLLQKLTAAGYHIQYVGSRTSDSPRGPLPHEAYSGKTAEFLASIIAKSFRDHPADIVLIHAGHNHSAEEKPIAKIIAAHESMIQEFRKTNPHVIILLAQVIPSGKLPKYSYIPALNQGLAKLAARLNTPDQPILLVNQSETFDPEKDTIQDKVHPNEKGAEKMATQWFNALTKILDKPN
jgi:lysophospholipase L1-like esterase